MAAIQRDYTIERGIPFSRRVTIEDSNATPLNLTGATFEAKIRESMLPTDIRAWPSGTGPFITNFDIAIVGAATNGIFNLALTIAETLLLQRGALYDYDVVMTISSVPRRILKGILTSTEIASHAD